MSVYTNIIIDIIIAAVSAVCSPLAPARPGVTDPAQTVCSAPSLSSLSSRTFFATPAPPRLS